MSSSFPAARFPLLALAKDQAESSDAHEKPTQSSTEVSDELLLTRIAAGDSNALAVLFRRYARLVWSVAERVVRNKAEADDLLQDVFLLIQRRASVFDSSKGTEKVPERPARSNVSGSRSKSRGQGGAGAALLRRIDRGTFRAGAAPESDWGTLGRPTPDSKSLFF